jgi:hypothetical protein
LIAAIAFATQLASGAALAPADDAFLEDLSRRAFLYFWEQADPQTGLVFDRATTVGARAIGRDYDAASIAATGFGLTALCIAAERGWISDRAARQRVRVTLRFFARRAPGRRGWYYHFLDAKTGARLWKSEVSSIDTALLLGGVLSVRQKFRGDREIAALSRRLYARADFHWMLNGDPALLSHGWTPEAGFIRVRWDSYNELAILYLLGMGSPAYPLPAASWDAWERPRFTYEGYSYVHGGTPLFTHQYSHAWIDFRGRRDRGPSDIDYFANSVTATEAHRAFCIRMAADFPQSYSADVWGITASDGPSGYRVWGGPPAFGPIDGTVAPCGPGGSLMFTPDLSLRALRTMRARFGDRIYGRYGFADAFNPTTGWTDPYVLGIDQGIILLSAENLRTGKVWRWFMANPEVTEAMRKAGFRRE